MVKFTHLKSKSTEDIFKDKSDLEIYNMFYDTFYTEQLKMCVEELLKRDSNNIIKKLCKDWPHIMNSLWTEHFKDNEKIKQYTINPDKLLKSSVITETIDKFFYFRD